MNQLFANPVAAMMQGQMAAQGVNDIRRNNALNRLYQEQGPAIAAGDPQGINALAQLDPMAAADLRMAGAREKRADRGLQIDEERLGMAKQQARLAAEQMMQAGRAAEVQAEAEQTRRIVEDMGTALGRGDLQTFEALKGTLGDDFAGMSPETFPAFAAVAGASVSGMYDAMDAATPKPDYVTINDQIVDRNAPGGPAAVPVSGLEPPKPSFRAATPEEAAEYGATAGQIDEKTGRFHPINPPKGMKIESDGKGGFVLTEGPGVNATGQDVTVGEVYNPSEVDQTIALIEDIMNDPALSRVTGPIEGGGGNDVRELNLMQRTYYGDKGLSVIQKINQLQSRAWMAARQMLKGGGPITDYESRKAEAAVARLERAQGDAEFKAALKDLLDAIKTGREKLEASGGARQPLAPQGRGAPQSGVTEDGYVFLGGDPGDPKNWEKAE